MLIRDKITTFNKDFQNKSGSSRLSQIYCASACVFVKCVQRVAAASNGADNVLHVLRIQDDVKNK